MELVKALEDRQLFDDDEICLKKLADMLPEGAKVIEIGCWTGFSTMIIGTTVKYLNGLVYVVDTFDGRGSHLETVAPKFDVKGFFDKRIKENFLQSHIVLKHMSSDDAVKEFEPESIDMVFIDGDHRYSQVSKDIDNYYKFLKKGGIMSGHDLNRLEYDERFVEEDYVENNHHGVAKAIDELPFEVNTFNNSSIWWFRK